LEIEFWPEAIHFAYGNRKIGKSGGTDWCKWHAVGEFQKDLKTQNEHQFLNNYKDR
jgi:hypothetical protein